MKILFFSLVALCSTCFVSAQTADEIVAKHVEAVGGKEKLAEIKSVVIQSSIEVMGNSANTKTTIVNGKGFKNESDFNGQQMVQAVNENGGWAINPFGGSGSPEAMPEAQYKSSMDEMWVPDPLFEYQAHGGTVVLDGQEKIGEVNAYKLKYTGKGGLESAYYIDPATYFIVRVVQKTDMMGQEVTMTSDLSDYQISDFGVYLAHSANVDLGQFAMTRKLKEVKFNDEVDLSIFEMPK